MRGLHIAIVAMAVAFSGHAEAKKPEITGLELQQIQSRDYEVGKETTFPAVMSVLQDAGYRIQAADRDTGLITAIASTTGHMTWVPFLGLGRKKLTPVVSAYIEDRGRFRSRIRLNFVMSKMKSNGYGSTNDEDPITDTAVYQDAFEKINKAVFVRQALDAPAAGTEPSAPNATNSTTAPETK